MTAPEANGKQFNPNLWKDVPTKCCGTLGVRREGYAMLIQNRLRPVECAKVDFEVLRCVTCGQRVDVDGSTMPESGKKEGKVDLG